MARGGRSALTVDTSEFEKNLFVMMDRVERGTRKATVAACEDIIELSLELVPRDTGALAKSAFYEVHGYRKNFVGIVGYGGNGVVNPNTGKPVSDYMVTVHEDLYARHEIGQAKFLEDAVVAYQTKFKARAANILRRELGPGR